MTAFADIHIPNVWRNDPEPWGKAFSISVIIHSGLFLLLLVMTLVKTKEPQTVLTEVKFVPVKTQAEAAAPGVSNPEPVRGTVTGNGGSADVNVDARGSAPLSTQGGQPLPSGSKGERLGLSQPLSGPIVATETLGWIGQKRGALVELPKWTGGTVGGGMKTLNDTTLSDSEPMALGRTNLDDIRRAESRLGAPLVSEQVIQGSVEGRTKRLATTNFAERKKATAESLKANPLDRDKWGKQKGPFSLEGPLKYRKILKMELPPYPRWAEEQALETSVSIRLWVNPKGKVMDNMYLEKTSGYSELDHLAIDALKNFVFVPLPENQSQEDEWGVATFRFELKK